MDAKTSEELKAKLDAYERAILLGKEEDWDAKESALVELEEAFLALKLGIPTEQAKHLAPLPPAPQTAGAQR